MEHVEGILSVFVLDQAVDRELRGIVAADQEAYLGGVPQADPRVVGFLAADPAGRQFRAEFVHETEVADRAVGAERFEVGPVVAAVVGGKERAAVAVEIHVVPGAFPLCGIGRLHGDVVVALRQEQRFRRRVVFLEFLVVGERGRLKRLQGILAVLALNELVNRELRRAVGADREAQFRRGVERESGIVDLVAEPDPVADKVESGFVEGAEVRDRAVFALGLEVGPVVIVVAVREEFRGAVLVLIEVDVVMGAAALCGVGRLHGEIILARFQEERFRNGGIVLELLVVGKRGRLKRLQGIRAVFALDEFVDRELRRAVGID